jgi:hypothetical protein
MSAVTVSPVFRLDRDEFVSRFARRPVAVDHTLADDPLLSLEEIANLAERFPGRVERHSADLPQVMPGGAPAPGLDLSPSEMVRGIEHNRCWMVFWYVDQDPAYKALLDRCLDQAESFLPSGTGPALQREAFLFLSAPNAVTPIHFDPEHNFLLQIRGHKDMNVCPFPSVDVERRELDRYHSGGDRNLPSLPPDGEVFGLDPGRGVYVPSFMPHWVQNGPRASVSLSITFRSRESLRAERVHRINAQMRRFRLHPTPAGVSPARDRAKEAMWVAVAPTVRGSQRRLAALRQPRGARSAGPATN